MSNFITNSGGGDLKSRLIELIEKSQELKFLVGFFYFSGIQELFDGLKKNSNTKLNVLVGLNVDEFIFGLLEHAGEIVNEDKASAYVGSVRKSLNIPDFDNKDFYDQVRFFAKMIEEERLIIRKTREPNHAKLYLFKLEQGQAVRNLFITGSSNLTKAGLITQNEFNVEISSYGFEDAEKYFDDLWQFATRITENNVTREQLLKVLKRKSTEASPFEAYVLLLDAYLASYRHKTIRESSKDLMQKKGYEPYRYQIDAVEQALATVDDHGGVIVADVVGLGKSVIASLIAKEIGQRGIIICPPTIIGDEKKKDSGWAKYDEDFELPNWVIYSSGDLGKPIEFIKKHPEIEVVIIDEAHRFRNRDTEGYELLKNICRGKKVILLTATPFNNRPNDILSLLSLFITPKKSGISPLSSNIQAEFKAYDKEFRDLRIILRDYDSKNSARKARAQAIYKARYEDKPFAKEDVKKKAHYIAKQIRAIIEPVTIRRNRLDIKNNPAYAEEVKNLSTMADPEEWYFELSKDQSDFYDKIVETYFGDGGEFRGAIYRPYAYEFGEDGVEDDDHFESLSQKNLFDFMRRLLVKRFESSFGSFIESIKRFKSTHDTVLKFIEKSGGKYILDRKLIDKIYEEDLDIIDEALQKYEERLLNDDQHPKNEKIYKVATFKKGKEFLEDIKKDRDLLSRIIKEVDELKLVSNDPKVSSIIPKIKSVFNEKPLSGEPKRKVIIFSEYVDTVNHIKPYLEKAFPDRVLIVAGVLPQKTVRAVYSNFDASFEKREDQYDILLTSDKLSEGFNLNRAGMVINYDIPWNPVRVIQRVGRINRIGKKVFSELRLANFFPSETGANFIRSREIAEHKMFLIHNTLGEDTKIFDVDEEPTAAELFTRISRNPDDLEQESFYTTISKEYEDIKSKHPEVISRIKDFQPRVKTAKKHTDPGMMVFFRGSRLAIREGALNLDGKQIREQVPFEDVYEKIRCDINEPGLEWNDNSWGLYQEIKDYIRSVMPPSEASLEQRALNVLNYILQSNPDGMESLMDFVKTLREDILDYGTLPEYTLRRLANLKLEERTAHALELVKTISGVRDELGSDYLDYEKEKIKRQAPKELIVAIENRNDVK